MLINNDEKKNIAKASTIIKIKKNLILDYKKFISETY